MGGGGISGCTEICAIYPCLVINFSLNEIGGGGGGGWVVVVLLQCFPQNKLNGGGGGISGCTKICAIYPCLVINFSLNEIGGGGGGEKICAMPLVGNQFFA